MTGDDDRPVGEDDLQALIDDRLPPDRAVTVERALESNPALAATAEADRRLRAELRNRLAFKAAEPIPARLRIAHVSSRRRRGQREMARSRQSWTRSSARSSFRSSAQA